MEMEALTGVNVALLTIYDMCKAIDKSMELTDIHLEERLTICGYPLQIDVISGASIVCRKMELCRSRMKKF